MRVLELIEELKKAPYNSDVKVELLLTPDFMDESFKGKGDCYLEKMQITGIRHIPEVVLEVKQ